MMRRSTLTAAMIALAAILWVAVGRIVLAPSEASLPGDAATTEESLFTVRVRELTARRYIDEITIRGRTEAMRHVAVKSETDGRVVETPVDRGEVVETGDVICRLAPDDRLARLAEAKALAAQRDLEYKAAIELARKGHRSETQAAAAKAQLDAALAQVSFAEVELAHTRIRAPFDGFVDDRQAEVGDFLQEGSTCATLLFEDPFLVVGEAAESDVDKLAEGGRGQALLTDGRTLEGSLRFISKSANPETRTFRVELEVANPDRSLREGMTAELRIPISESYAHFIEPSLLVLNDKGQVGIRTVEQGKVRFHAADILGDSLEGMWIAGLPSSVTVITVGQAFVKDGQAVKTSLEGAEAAP